MEHVGGFDTRCNWHPRNDPQKLDKETWRIGNRKMSRDYSNYNIF